MLIEFFLFINLIKLVTKSEAGNSILINPLPNVVDVKSIEIESNKMINGENLNNGKNSSMRDNSSQQAPTKSKKLACY